VRAFIDQANSTREATRVAIAGLADLCARSTLTASDLALYEKTLDDALREFRLVAEEIAPKGNWDPVVSKPQYEPILRLFVAFSTLVAVASQHLSEVVGFAWGDHLFSESDFRLIEFDRIEKIPPIGRTMLARDLAGELADAQLSLTRLGVGRVHKKIRDFELHLVAICKGLGADVAVLPSLETDLFWSKSDIANELSCSEGDIDQKCDDRELIFVFQWSGDKVFPRFQFVLQNTPSKFSGWSLMLWMKENLDESDDHYKEVLEECGLWVPSWGIATNAFDAISTSKPKEKITYELKRIARKRNGPFYFAFSDDPGAGTPELAGRFDLFKSSRKGTLYTALTCTGACHETLDREPVLTLRDVLDRSMWTLTCQSEVEVSDLTGLKTRVVQTPNRLDTQEFAMKFHPVTNGMKVGLKTKGDETGIAIFGAQGATLPGATGVGAWSATRVPLVECEFFWQYVKVRGDDQRFPVWMRRFPSEVFAK
jgi:hypothetical protein